MKIQFVRSGGFAGAATRVEGIADLDAGVVTSDAVGYRRALAPGEADQIKAAAPALKSDPPAPNAPDGIRYHVTITGNSANPQTFDFRAQGGAETSPLVKFVVSEAQKIWDFRLSKR